MQELFKFDDPLPSNAELEAIEFSAVKLQAREKLWELALAFHEAMSDAIGVVLTKSKEDLIAAMGESQERYLELGSWLGRFHDAADHTRSLADILAAAEARLAVALAVVEGDDDPGGWLQ